MKTTLLLIRYDCDPNYQNRSRQGFGRQRAIVTGISSRPQTLHSIQWWYPGIEKNPHYWPFVRDSLHGGTGMRSFDALVALSMMIWYTKTPMRLTRTGTEVPNETISDPYTVLYRARVLRITLAKMSEPGEPTRYVLVDFFKIKTWLCQNYHTHL